MFDKWFSKVTKKLYLYLYDVQRDIHLKKHSNDIKCPTCHEWFSISGLKYKHKNETRPNEPFFRTTCGQCDTTSFWRGDIAPVLLRCDEKGIPIRDDDEDKNQ